jgi:hypothetical protein
LVTIRLSRELGERVAEFGYPVIGELAGDLDLADDARDTMAQGLGGFGKIDEVTAFVGGGRCARWASPRIVAEAGLGIHT